MPHCIVEYSKALLQRVTIEELLNEVFLGALASELFELDDIKLRAIPFGDYQIGEVKADFVHVVVKILDSRTGAQKQYLSQHVLNHLKRLELSHISLTVEVVDIDRASYGKFVT